MCRRDCIYAGGVNIQYGSGQHSCSYSGIMTETNQEMKTRLGQLCKMYRLPSTHRKIKLLMMGVNCPFYEEIYTGKKRRKACSQILPRKPREKKEHKAPADEERLRELYEQGLSDRKIAEELDLKEYNVYAWRRERGLPGNFHKTHNRIDEERARELLEEGLTDTQIAMAIGCSQAAIYHWRKRNGLKPKYPYSKMDQTRLRELYDQGLNDTQISRATGHCTDAIRRWRKRNGLKSNWEEQK